jgi:hypothetical protein
LRMTFGASSCVIPSIASEPVGYLKNPIIANCSF